MAPAALLAARDDSIIYTSHTNKWHMSTLINCILFYIVKFLQIQHKMSRIKAAPECNYGSQAGLGSKQQHSAGETPPLLAARIAESNRHITAIILGDLKLYVI